MACVHHLGSRQMAGIACNAWLGRSAFGLEHGFSNLCISRGIAMKVLNSCTLYSIDHSHQIQHPFQPFLYTCAWQLDTTPAGVHSWNWYRFVPPHNSGHRLFIAEWKAANLRACPPNWCAWKTWLETWFSNILLQPVLFCLRQSGHVVTLPRVVSIGPIPKSHKERCAQVSHHVHFYLIFFTLVSQRMCHFIVPTRLIAGQYMTSFWGFFFWSKILQQYTMGVERKESGLEQSAWGSGQQWVCHWHWIGFWLNTVCQHQNTQTQHRRVYGQVYFKSSNSIWASIQIQINYFTRFKI